MSPERRRLAFALLLSLLIHTLLLSLTFGGQGLGLPGFGFPWQERRIEVPDLHVVLMPAQVKAAEPARTAVEEPLQQASIEQPVAGRPALTPSVSPVPTLGRTAEAIAAEAKLAAKTEPEADAATGAVPARAPLRSATSGDTAPTPIPEPAVIAMERSDEAALVVPPAPSVPKPVIAAAPGASSPDTVMPAPREAGDAVQERINPGAREQAVERAELDRSEQEAQRQAVQLEAARLAIARLEAERQEAARQAAARQEAARQEATRQEAQRVETARLEAERQEAARQAAALQEAARQEAARQEAQRVETARLEAGRQEAARQAAALQEAARQEAARQEAQRVETVRLEAERQEAARQAVARQEAARQEATRQEAQRVETARLEVERQEAARQAVARQEAARQEAARQEAQRIETARLEAERQEAARQAAARQEAARVEAAQQAAARREAALRAIGRQLDEEAAKREAASTAAGLPSTLAPSSSSARRGRLFGRTDPNAELILYAEAWARKIQLNMTFDMVREAAKRPHNDPLVTVAIRSDGSVESVTFVRSSGVAEIDDAIQRIVQSQVPYQAFPPGLAREFDVIEIRRTWHFDMAIRLY